MITHGVGNVSSGLWWGIVDTVTDLSITIYRMSTSSHLYYILIRTGYLNHGNKSAYLIIISASTSDTYKSRLSRNMTNER